MPRPDRERTRLLAVLTAAIGIASLALIAMRGAPIAPLWMIAVIGVPWLALMLFLRVHRETWGKELRYLDLWSVTHVVAGLLLGILGIGLVWVVLLTVAWELIEVVARVEEYLTNRITDVVVALVAWPVAQAAYAGGFPLW